MVHLTAINKTNRAYTDTDHELLFLGIFNNKKLNPSQRSLDSLIDNALSEAIECDGFTGKKDKQLNIYGNNSTKRIVLFGLGNQKKYTSDRARSIASNICRYANNINVSEFSVDGDSFGLQKNGYTQAFCEGLVLGSYEFKDYKTEDDENNKVEVYMITSPKVKSKISGLFEEDDGEIAAYGEMEDKCKKDFKKFEGNMPPWNFKERNKKTPKRGMKNYAKHIQEYSESYEDDEE